MSDQTVSDDRTLKDTSANRSACTECQRRKQKCNREWPCINCHKRKVADKCRFTNESEVNSAWTPSNDVRRKRERSAENSGEDWDAGEGLEAMGYTASHILASLEIGSTPKNTIMEQYRLDPKKSPQLQRALDVLPERSIIERPVLLTCTLDSLIQNFLDNVNFYYYVVYPPKFLKQYEQWWQDRTKGRTIGVSWTCLLIMVCACSVQHTDAELRHSLENDLKSTVKDLSDKYHDASRELHSVIPVGHNHMFNVQYLLHSCYWFKAEARFVECWHVLGSAVREAQMLGLHKESTAQLTQFDREMRRRLWCIVDAWDWLVSALLARPMLINREDSAVGLPSLTLEEYPTSPLLHMKLQSDLVSRIFNRFGPPRLLTEPADIQEYQMILESFMKTFPQSYAFENPDTSGEDKYPWIALHRHYMHTCTLSIALGPFRPYLAKSMSRMTPPMDLTFRRDGINYAFRLMNAVHSFFEYVWVRDTTFHFVPFCIFDTAALLCSAVLHDEDGSLPRRDEILASIDRALVTLKRLSTATDTAKTPLDILRRLHNKIRAVAPVQTYWAEDPRKRYKLEDIQVHPGPQGAPMSMPYVHVGNGVHSGMSTQHTAYIKTGSPEYSDSGVSAGSRSMYTIPSTAGSVVLPTTASQTIPGGLQCSIESSQSWTYFPDPQVSAPPPQMSAPVASSGLAAHHGLVVSAPEMYASMPQAVSASQAMAPDPSAAGMGFEMVSHDMGDLAEMWNWQSLDLGFASNPMLQPQQPQPQPHPQQYQ